MLCGPNPHNSAKQSVRLCRQCCLSRRHPFNLLAGVDVNGPNHFTNDRPPGAPRNSGLGPNYTTFDMRLARTIKVGEHLALRFTAEGFNLTNRTNYARVNNIVGATFAP